MNFKVRNDTDLFNDEIKIASAETIETTNWKMSLSLVSTVRQIEILHYSKIFYKEVLGKNKASGKKTFSIQILELKYKLFRLW